jgi:hypothetical protein
MSANCPDGRPCFLNVCGVHSPKIGGPPGCFRIRLDSLKAAKTDGGQPRYNAETDLFERDEVMAR